jgi:N-acetylneuraminic acid mutarotase
MKRIVLFFCLFLALTYLNAQEWEPVASLPGGQSDARHHPVNFTIDGYGYVLTGSVNGVPSRDFMRYDPVTDTWEELPDFPGPVRTQAYGTARGTKAYMGFGGTSNSPYNDLWEYDATTEEWTQLADCPCQPRYHPAFVQLEGKIFVGMGNGQFGNLRDWWEYDIPTDTWTQRDNLPGPTRHHPFYFGIDSIAYVGFGHGSVGGSSANIYKDFYKYDPSTEEWTQLNTFLGEARVAGTQFDYNGKGYILSGDGDNHSFMAEGEFWEYDPALDEWTQLPSHPGSSRWAPGNFVIDNYVYFMCGLSTVRLESDMMRFELSPPLVNTDEVVEDETSIQIFPNPTSSIISFTEDVSQFSEILLVNSIGQVMKRVLTNHINVKEFPDGMYYLHFLKDETRHIEKFVILK